MFVEIEDLNAERLLSPCTSLILIFEPELYLYFVFPFRIQSRNEEDSKGNDIL